MTDIRSAIDMANQWPSVTTFQKFKLSQFTN